MSQTMLAEKLQRSGFIQREVRFTVAIARALNVGGVTGLRHFLDGVEEFQLEHGTMERARELLAVAADKMGAGGHTTVADQARGHVPPASRPVGDEGHPPSATAIESLPSSPSEDSVAGQGWRADGQSPIARPLSPNREQEGQMKVALGRASAASPAREPSALDRAAAIKAARTSAVAVLTIFDRHRVRDGRPLKKVRFHELSKLAQEDEGTARAYRYMLAEVQDTVANPNGMALIPELVSAELAERAFRYGRMGNA